MISSENTFSYIIDTDYSTYFVEYACKQSLADFWTLEYVDVYTKDGTLSSGTLTTIKTNLATSMPDFDTSTLLEAKSGGACPYSTVWGIF